MRTMVASLSQLKFNHGVITFPPILKFSVSSSMVDKIIHQARNNWKLSQQTFQLHRKEKWCHLLALLRYSLASLLTQKKAKSCSHGQSQFLLIQMTILLRFTFLVSRSIWLYHLDTLPSKFCYFSVIFINQIPTKKIFWLIVTILSAWVCL